MSTWRSKRMLAELNYRSTRNPKRSSSPDWILSLEKKQDSKLMTLSELIAKVEPLLKYAWQTCVTVKIEKNVRSKR